MHRLSLLAAVLLCACGLLGDSHSISIPFTLEAQEFKHEFAGQNGASLPAVDCAKDASSCGTIQNLPAGATVACEAGKCVAHYALQLPVPVNLSQQANFPSQVSNSALINDVQVSAVHYWTAMNGLNFDTPPIDVYIGGQTVMKETDPGVSNLGTLPSIPAMMKTACGSGNPGTAESACDMTLTNDGKRALGTLARDFKTPFTVLLVAHLTVHGGEPFPSGVLDLFLQPVIAFVLPL